MGLPGIDEPADREDRDDVTEAADMIECA